MQNEKKPVITIMLVAVNVLVFLILSMFGRTEDSVFMLEHGAMYMPHLLEYDQYSMLFTSMFLHFGFSHLMNNMLVLFLLGSVLERELGSMKYLLLYLLSGIGGNVLSAVVEIFRGEFYVSAGASGAIFGVIGALLLIMIRNKGHLRTLSSRGLVFMVICSLYHGFTSTGVDNMAHIGGLVTGFILAALIYRKRHIESGPYIYVR